MQASVRRDETPANESERGGLREATIASYKPERDRVRVRGSWGGAKKGWKGLEEEVCRMVYTTVQVSRGRIRGRGRPLSSGKRRKEELSVEWCPGNSQVSAGPRGRYRIEGKKGQGGKVGERAIVGGKRV